MLIVGGEERKLSRTITAAGASEYRINGKVVKADEYERSLGELNINVRARNFLVFQGDVADVAAKSPKELTAMIERLSGSDALKQAYDEAVEAKKEVRAEPSRGAGRRGHGGAGRVEHEARGGHGGTGAERLGAARRGARCARRHRSGARPARAGRHWRRGCEGVGGVAAGARARPARALRGAARAPASQRCRRTGEGLARLGEARARARSAADTLRLGAARPGGGCSRSLTRAQAEEKTLYHYQKKKSLQNEQKVLKLQRDEANKFEQLDAAQRAARQRLALLRLYSIEVAIAELEVERQRAIDRHAKARDAHDKAEADAAGAKRNAARHAKERMQLERKAAAAARDADKTKPRGIKLHSEIAHLDKQIAMAKKSAEALRKKTQTQSSALKALRDELRQLERAEAAADAKHAEEERAEPELTLTAAQLERRAELSAKAGAQTAATQEKLAATRRALKACERTVAQLTDDAAAASADARAADEQAAELSERADATSAEIERQHGVAAKAEEQAKALEKERAAAEKRASELRAKLTAGQAQLVELRAERSETERDAKLRESLEALQRQLKGVHGRLIDLCTPAKRAWDGACAVALGKNMEAIVVDTEETAREAIKYLKEQRYAPQTFIPLDGIRPKPIAERLRSLGGSMRLVVDCLSFERQYEPAVRFAAADTLICDSLEEARELCYRSAAARRGERHKVVALDGTLIAKSGIMTGGAASDGGGGGGFGKRGGGGGGGSRWDQRKFHSLKEELEAAQAELTALERNSKQHSTERIEKLRAQAQAAKGSLTEAKADLQTTNAKRKELAKRSKARADDAAKTAARLDAEKASLAKLSAEEATLAGAARESGKDTFAELSAELGVDDLLEREQKVAARRRAHEAKKIEFERVAGRLRAQLQHEERKGLPAAIEKVEAQVAADERARADKGAELAEWQAEADASQEQQEQIDAELAQAHEQQRALDEEAKAAKARATDAKRELDAAAKKLGTVDGQMDSRREERRAAFGRARLDEVAVPMTSGTAAQRDHAAIARKRAAAEDTAALDSTEAQGRKRGEKKRKQAGGRGAPSDAAAAPSAPPLATPLLLGASESFSPSGFVGTGTAGGAPGGDGAGASTANDAGGSRGAGSEGPEPMDAETAELIRIDFKSLSDEDKGDAAMAAAAAETHLEELLAQLRAISPNLKAQQQYADLEAKIADSDQVFAASRKAAAEAKKVRPSAGRASAGRASAGLNRAGRRRGMGGSRTRGRAESTGAHPAAARAHRPCALRAARAPALTPCAPPTLAAPPRARACGPLPPLSNWTTWPAGASSCS